MLRERRRRERRLGLGVKQVRLFGEFGERAAALPVASRLVEDALLRLRQAQRAHRSRALLGYVHRGNVRVAAPRARNGFLSDLLQRRERAGGALERARGDFGALGVVAVRVARFGRPRARQVEQRRAPLELGVRHGGLSLRVERVRPRERQVDVAGLLADREPALQYPRRAVVRQQRLAFLFRRLAGGHRLRTQERQGLEVLLGALRVLGGVPRLDVRAEGGGGVQVLALGTEGRRRLRFRRHRRRFRFGAESVGGGRRGGVGGGGGRGRTSGVCRNDHKAHHFGHDAKHHACRVRRLGHPANGGISPAHRFIILLWYRTRRTSQIR